MNLNLIFTKALHLGLFSLVVVLLVGSQVSSAQAPASNLLISVAFKTNNPVGNSPPMSGPEAAATLANPWVDVVLSGAVTTGQLASNLAALSVSLSSTELDALATLGEPSPRYWSFRRRLPWS